MTNLRISILESNGKTEDEESDMKVVAMHPVFEEDQKQKSSSAFRLWKEQKEDRKRASSRSLSGGKMTHLFHEINRSNIFNH